MNRSVTVRLCPFCNSAENVESLGRSGSVEICFCSDCDESFEVEQESHTDRSHHSRNHRMKTYRVESRGH
jgi:transcription elongation factor Elf1